MFLTPDSVFAKRYRIVRLLEEGGMGAVYEAEQVRVGRKVALKVMRPELVASAEHRARFEAEARASARIESDYVVAVYDHDVDEETRTPWIAMEFLRGENLGAMVARRGALTAPEVLAIFDDLAKGLGPAHAAGVIHLDLKPENLFVARLQDRTIVKVLDFGISKIAAEQRKSARVTTIIASPMFLAPEQAKRNARVSPETDVWALGLIAFYLLTGRYYWRSANLEPGEVFDQGAQLELLLETNASGLDPASTRARSVGSSVTLPRGFDAWFARCVTRDAPRFTDATEAIDALREVLAPFGETTVPSPGSIAPPPLRVTPTPSAPHLLDVAQATPSIPPGERWAPGSSPQLPATRLIAESTVAPTLPLPSGPFPVSADPVRVVSSPAAPLVEAAEPSTSSRSRLVAVVGVFAALLVLAAAVDGARRSSRGVADAPTTTNATTQTSTEVFPPATAGMSSQPALPAESVAPTPTPPPEDANAFVALPDGALAMQQSEVTRREFATWQRGAHPELAPPGGDLDLPVVNVTRELATQYCASLGARLPTRVEWQTALGRDRAWTRGVGPARALSAGGASPSDERVLRDGSLYDLVANVNEWTSDGADSAPLAMGAFFGEERSLVADYLRDGNVEAGATEHTGFRCVRYARINE